MLGTTIHRSCFSQSVGLNSNLWVTGDTLFWPRHAELQSPISGWPFPGCGPCRRSVWPRRGLSNKLCNVTSVPIMAFFVRKVLCMQFGTLTWILHVLAFISAWHFNMVVASHCSCFAQCVGRGQGSAAGAAEDHMTCMLDALKCMELYT